MIFYFNRICERPDDIRFQPHLLRTSSLCWCEVFSMERQRKFGLVPPLYVIEVRIAALHPSQRTPEASKALATLLPETGASPLEQLSWPAFVNEDNSLFVRFFASVVKVKIHYCIREAQNATCDMFTVHQGGSYQIQQHSNPNVCQGEIEAV